MENVIRTPSAGDYASTRELVVPRIGDIYAALPAITGKLELEYEGEMKGADFVGRELIRTALAKAYDAYLTGVNMQQIVQWFDLGGEIQLADSARRRSVWRLRQDSGIDGEVREAERAPKDTPEYRFRRRSLFSKACTPTNESDGMKSACLRRERNSPKRRRSRSTARTRRIGREGSLISP